MLLIINYSKANVQCYQSVACWGESDPDTSRLVIDVVIDDSFNRTLMSRHSVLYLNLNKPSIIFH